MKSVFAKARQPEIIRASQKDLSYTNELTENISEIVRSTYHRAWLVYSNQLKLAAEIFYYGFACIYDLQTLGEEYTGIIQIDTKSNKLPSITIRLLATFLEYGGEAFYLLVLRRFEKEVTASRTLLDGSRKKLIQTIQLMKAAIPAVKCLHRTIFYFNAQNYTVSKRLTGINYVLIRRWLKQNNLYGYKMLGNLSLLHLLLTLGGETYEQYLKQKHQVAGEMQTKNSKSSERLEATEEKCALCIDFTENVSVIVGCGHIFCWECIYNWLHEREECPVCREPTKKTDVLLLQNY